MSRGRLYLRCEANEWDFIQEMKKEPPFDAAVISDRYLAPYPEGHRSHGLRADRLVKAVEACGRRWSVDPDTARLGHRDSVRRQRPHAANRAIAKALPLPLTVERLRDPDSAAALVEAAAVNQLGSRTFAAPYLEIDDFEDPRFAVNIDLLRRSRELAGDRTLIAYLQLLGGRMRDGDGVEAARRLAAAGAEVLFVRVRRFEPELASPDDLLAYGGIVSAGVSEGARVVGDCVGRLGPALIALGADGFATNAHRFRKVAEDLHPAGGGGGSGPPLMWEVPDSGSARLPGDALATAECTVLSCPGPEEASNTTTRIHNLHDLRRLARLAAQEGLGYAEHLLASASPVHRGWGVAIQELAEEAA